MIRDRILLEVGTLSLSSMYASTDGQSLEEVCTLSYWPSKEGLL